MREENDAWVHILPESEIQHYSSIVEYLFHQGKWMIYGPKEVIEHSASKIESLVGKKEIREAKFSKKPALEVPNGYGLGEDHVLIVYCDDRERDTVKSALEKELGVKELFWRYDRETWARMLKEGEEVPKDIEEELKKIL